jgi:exopolyphosphatase/guanosine-5'-triphosphate,3'-diphosphate pyrophosphatase
MQEDVSQAKKELHDWLIENAPKSNNSIRALGTGGSIGKVYEMAQNPIDQPITFYKISEIKELIERHSIDDRINILKLSPDRADVIVPAIDIYLEVMKTVEATTMSVPKVGLSDGMFEVMFQEKILS